MLSFMRLPEMNPSVSEGLSGRKHITVEWILSRFRQVVGR